MSNLSYLTSCLLALLLFGSFVAGRSIWVGSDQAQSKSDNRLSLQFSSQKEKVLINRVEGVRTKKVSIAEIRKKKPKKQSQKRTVKRTQNNKPKGLYAHRKLINIEPPSQVIYQVNQGDRLDLISNRFYGTHHRYNEILAANPHLSNPESLRPGMKLVIPKAKKPQKNHSYYDYSQVPKRKYVFKSNDVLGLVAQRELGTVKMLPVILQLNPGLNPRKIRPGQEIYLPVKQVRRNRLQ